jgi:hypothetical protein
MNFLIGLLLGYGFTMYKNEILPQDRKDIISKIANEIFSDKDRKDE